MLYNRLKNWLDTFLFYILFLLLGLLLFCVCWQVFSRYFLRMPATFTEELVRFVLIWVGFLGAAYGFGNHKHLSLTFFIEQFPVSVRIIARIASILLIMVLSVLLLMWGGFRMIQVTHSQFSSVLNIRMSYVYMVIPFAGIMILLYQIFDLISLIFTIKRGKA
ncbi:MAG: TRAP transporter small permease [Brevinemataceae bacterium]